MADAATQLDLGVGNVHTPGTIGTEKRVDPQSGHELMFDAATGGTTPMSEAIQNISAEKRKGLPEDKFAIPSKRKYPIDTAARTRNAAARLEQAHKSGKVTDADYHQARARIAKAAKHFGIDSQYNATDNTFKPEPGKDKRSRVPSSVTIRADIAPGGAIHVRHQLKYFAGEGMPVLCTLDEGGTDDAPKPVWIQLAKPGTFRGHPSGRAFTLDAKLFREMITNFKANEDGRLPIDFEHASEQDPTDGTIPTTGAPAQGWIVDMALRPDGNLWAKVEWSALARQYIREGKYRFISPAIHFEMKDRVTGKNIGAYCSSAGLTNAPFLSGMEPLAARIDGAGAGVAPTLLAGVDPLDAKLRHPSTYMSNLRMCLGLTELATHDECTEQLTRLSERCSLAGIAGDGHLHHEGIDLTDKYLSSLAQCAGLTMASTSTQDILDAVQDMIDEAIAQHVDEYHGGANMSARQPADAAIETTTTIEDTNMDPKAELNAANEKITTLTGEVTTLTTKHRTVTDEVTTLKAGVSDVLTLCKASGYEPKSGEGVKELVARVLEDNKTLLKAKTDRDESDILRDVETAIVQYGPDGLKKFDDAQAIKAELVELRRASPAVFLRQYKPLTADEVRLGRRDAVAPEPKRERREGKVMMSHSALTSRLQREKGLSYADASDEAARMIRENDVPDPKAGK